MVTRESGRHELENAEQSTAPTLAGRMELWIASLLRVGVVVSLAWICAGTALTFHHHPTYFSSEQAVSRVLEKNAAPTSLAAVIEGLSEARGRAMTMAGLLVLILLPVLRLVVAHWCFRAQGDAMFARITISVLALLVASIALGLAT